MMKATRSAVVGFAMAALGGAALAGGPVSPEATGWVRANAIPFTTPEAGSGLKELEPLKKVVGGARIVGLGEPTHGTREAFQMKHRLLEFLVAEMGFTIFSIEASTPEAYALNDYVLEGKGDPRALIAGMYFWTWNTEEVLAMVEWMREWNKTHEPKVQFTGFDMQTPDVAAQIARDFCAKNAPELADVFSTLPKRVHAAQMATFGGGGGGFGVANGSFPVTPALGKKVVFSGWIRTEELQGGWAGLWWRCDGADPEHRVLAFDNMQLRGPRGTTPWTRYEISMDVPPETINIAFGMLMPGEGKAWFDDLEITLDGVAYSDPQKLCLDFEDQSVRSFSANSGGYQTKRSEVQPHGGKLCLEISSLPKDDAQKVDPKAVLADAEKAFNALLAKRDELAPKAGAKETEWAVHNARILAQCAKMFSGEFAAGSNIRDESMAENVGWILEQNPGAKIVLWAHNGHVSHGTMWGTKWMGSHLAEKFPGQMVVFGFATGSGKYTAMHPNGGLRSDNELNAAPEESIEAYLASAGIPNLLLDVRGAKEGDPASGWAVAERPMRGIGALAMDEQFSNCSAQGLYDVLVYQESTTAARQLTSKPASSKPK